MTYKRRARTGCTYDPCHGCGSTHMRKKDALCGDCQKVIEAGRAAQAAAAKQTDRVPYRLPSVIHYYPHLSPGDHHPEFSAPRPLQKALFSLVHACGEPVPEGVSASDMDAVEATSERRWDGKMEQAKRVDYLIDGTEHGYRDRMFLFDPAVAEALKEADAAIRATLKAAFEEGKAEGRNLIRGLATGEVSVHDYEDDVRGESRRRR